MALFVANGSRIPPGGTSGEILRKLSDVDFDLNWEDPLNLKGDPGPTGATGPQGPAGAVGPQGPAGPTGLQGVPGVQGPAGAVGPQGQTGSAGATGAKGATGATGAKGDKGDQGATGAKGDNTTINVPGGINYDGYVASINEVVLLDATSRNLRVYMPPAAATNTLVTVRRVDSNTNFFVQLMPNSGQLIDGRGSIYLYVPMSTVTLQWDGVNQWRIVDLGGGCWYSNNGIFPNPGFTLLDFAKSSSQNVPDKTWTWLSADTTPYIRTYNSYRNSDRFTAPWSGRYEFGGQVSYLVNASGARMAALGLSPSGSAGVDPPGSLAEYVQLNAQGASYATVVAIPPFGLSLNAGDTVCLAAYQSSGASLTTTTGSFTCRFLAKWMST